ncbi:MULTISPECIES: ABC transporter permease subunit [unclassified Shinella]|uniref:ABC transporter permease subunit n=1 Tax=unclassified Shinella TaxID=2643062 RepID=UPI00225CC593|nr:MULTISPECIES: ABC transporter permease subunit [unclassified Shinella]MCO5136740.1 ABC transporter permease subunit [Shinella sp.]MDC7253584.1 ABC transporter permease subunit [Shinella sp. YE25]CAI0336217.1 ABC transporter permease subunit [Rhizobiaceae bacterium]CAK7254763.1 spermidine/putrescine transport system permease protein [Shinella sp. WSC3-e]
MTRSPEKLAKLVSSASPGLIYLWLLALVVAPNLVLFGTSFFKASAGLVTDEVTLRNYAAVFQSRTVLVLVMRTLVTAFVAAALASLVAYPLAFYVSRYMRGMKQVAVMLVVIPLWISLLMRVFAWRVILGENGAINSLLVTLGILSEPSDAFLYTRFAVVLTLAYMAIPYVFVSSFTALERVPESLLEASRDAGANRFQTFRNVVWPLSRQGLAIGFSLAFLLAVGDYVSPSMVGGLNGTMLGMVIASQFGMAGNWPLGAAQAVILMLAVALILAVIGYLGRSKGIIQAVDSGTGATLKRAATLRGRIGQILLKLAVTLPYLFLYAPLVVTLVFSFNDSRVQTFPLTGFTLQWYRELWTNTALIEAFQRTLFVAVLSTAAGTVIGVAFALILAYRVRAFGNVLQLALAVPVAIPGIVLGISLAIVAQFSGLPQGLPRVIVGHLSFVMPVIMLIVLTRLRALDPSFVEASLDLGATRMKTLLHVLLPMIRSAIIGGAMLGFTLSVDEVIVTLFLTGTEPTLPVYVWNQMRFGFTPSINAIFTLIGLISVAFVLCGLWVINRTNARTLRA